MIKSFLISIFFLSIGLKVNAATFGQIATDKEGNALVMSYNDAIRYCTDQNFRLPTIREFAELARSLGAGGILEASEYANQNGYMAIYRRSENGMAVVDFYFNRFGYKTPNNPSAQGYFWSSSDAGESFSATNTFYGRTGSVGFPANHLYSLLSVQCITD